jgi:hypothetical protein
MYEQSHTDAKLAYWVGKYLIFWGTRLFSSLVRMGGGGSSQLLSVAASQDLIGWTEFLHGKVSVEFESIQHIHLSLYPCCITAANWMKGLVSHLVQLSHSQWIFCNFTIHNNQRGYLHLQWHKEVLREVDQLLDTPPDKLPQDSQYLLEFDYSALYNALFECQSYWVLAMKAARRSGQCLTTLRQRLVVPHRCCAALRQPFLLQLDVT